MLHIDLWQSCQPRISRAGGFNCVNKRTAYVGWQPEDGVYEIPCVYCDIKYMGESSFCLVMVLSFLNKKKKTDEFFKMSYQ